MFRIPTTENTLHLLSDVRRGQWFVHDYESLLPVALSFLRGEKITEAAIRPVFEFSTSEAQFSAAIGNEAKAKQVAVIPIIGTITKYDSCFTTGAITYARAILTAANHPEVGAIVLDIDSGGGAGNPPCASPRQTDSRACRLLRLPGILGRLAMRRDFLRQSPFGRRFYRRTLPDCRRDGKNGEGGLHGYHSLRGRKCR